MILRKDKDAFIHLLEDSSFAIAPINKVQIYEVWRRYILFFFVYLHTNHSQSLTIFRPSTLPLEEITWVSIFYFVSTKLDKNYTKTKRKNYPTSHFFRKFRKNSTLHHIEALVFPSFSISLINSFLQFCELLLHLIPYSLCLNQKMVRAMAEDDLLMEQRKARSDNLKSRLGSDGMKERQHSGKSIIIFIFPIFQNVRSFVHVVHILVIDTFKSGN